MTVKQKRQLIQNNNIRAEVRINWTVESATKPMKFAPDMQVQVIAGPKRKFGGSQYLFRKQVGTIIAASANCKTFNPLARRSTTRYYVQFGDSVMGFDGNLLTPIGA